MKRILWRVYISVGIAVLMLLLSQNSTLQGPTVFLSTVARAQSMPKLEIGIVQGTPGTTVSVPITYTRNGTLIAGLQFSVDYDESCLTYADGNLLLPDDFGSSVIIHDAADSDGEIDVQIFTLQFPLPSLGDGVLATIDFTISTNPSCVDTTAAVSISSTEPFELTNTAGVVVVGMTANGGVIIVPHPMLTIVKQVINDDNGSAAPGDFTLSVTGSAVTSETVTFAGVDSPGVTLTLQAGLYAVTETVAAGYTASLSGDCAGSIADGEHRTCTVINDDITPPTGLAPENDGPTELGSSTTFNAVVSAGADINYTWDFGDGQSGSGTNVSHTYAATGRYTATATAVNGGGVQTATTTVEVVDVPISGLSATNDGPTEIGNVTSLQATITSGTNVTYSWVFGDGQSGIGANVSHTYAANGRYTATITAANGRGSQTAETVVEIWDVPTAGLAAANDSPTELGDSTNFNAVIAAGSNVAYSWDFGDSNGGSGENANHTYAAIGLYTATVTAINSRGSQTATTTVEVVDVPISGLSATNDGPTEIGNVTSLQATITSGTNVSYSWVFGDGQSGIGANVSHTYAANGRYTATVTAINSRGSQTATTTVEVVDVPISGLTATNDGPTEIGNATSLQASITSGTNVVYSWDLGDGQSGSGANVSHTYAATGRYTATVTATNGRGSQPVETVVEVRDVPISGLSPTNDGPTELGDSTNFSAVIVSGSNVAFSWDYGDGNGGSGENVSHTYAATGLYIATVTAINSRGSQAATTTVGVADVPIAGLSASNDGPTELGNSTSLQASSTSGTNVTYSWDLGDGQSGSGENVSHTYAATGRYTATVTATNSRGSLTSTTVVSIGDIARTVEPTATTTISHTDENGAGTEIQIPAGAVTQTTELLFTQVMTPAEDYDGYSFAGQAFTLEAFRDGARVGSFTFEVSPTVTLRYSDADVAGIDESSLLLLYWNGGIWEDAACSPYERRPDENWLAAPICHLSHFGLFVETAHGSNHVVYLPLVQR